MKSWLIELEDGVPKGLEYDGTAKSDWTDAHFAYNRRQMKLTSFTVVVAALEDAGVRYLVAGGLAVNAHGYLRFTKDVDIVVQLVPENIERAFAALTTAGYHPSVPIAAAQFANAEMRSGWIRDKNMRCCSFGATLIRKPLSICLLQSRFHSRRSMSVPW